MYNKDIDERVLISGLEALLHEVPSVGGFYNRRSHAVDITNIQVPVRIKSHLGTAVSAAEMVDTQGEDIFYTEMDVPGVLKVRTLVFTFYLCCCSSSKRQLLPPTLLFFHHSTLPVPLSKHDAKCHFHLFIFFTGPRKANEGANQSIQGRWYYSGSNP